MEALNALMKQQDRTVWTEGYYVLLNILEPIIPHVGWEMSDTLFKRTNFRTLPIDEAVFVKDSVTLAVTVNGKKRAEIEVNPSAEKEAIIAEAKTAVADKIEGMTIVKEIVVPGKLVNIVVKP